MPHRVFDASSDPSRNGGGGGRCSFSDGHWDRPQLTPSNGGPTVPLEANEVTNALHFLQLGQGLSSCQRLPDGKTNIDDTNTFPPCALLLFGQVSAPLSGSIVHDIMENTASFDLLIAWLGIFRQVVDVC